MPLTTNFWGWDAPVLDKAVAELTRGWRGGELDLSRLVMVVPTAEAARRLKEALALAAAAKDGAVTAPHVWHPEPASLFGWKGARIASRLEERIAWIQTLTAIEVGNYPGLFPVRPAATGLPWASAVAEMLVSLRRAIGAGGHDLAGVARLLADHEEVARWNDLARLELHYLSKLAAMSRADAQLAKREIAGNPSLPEGVQQVLVLAAPDLGGLMRQWLQNVSRLRPVTVFIQAPEGERASFDELGAPLVAGWGEDSGRRLPLRDDMLRLCQAPDDQAVSVVDFLREFAGAGLSSAAGACHAELNPHLESELAAAGVAAYDPAGGLAAQHALMDLLRAWLALADSRAWKPLAAFLRRDDPLTALARIHDVAEAAILAQLDQLHSERLPGTVEDALALCDAARQPKLHAVLADVSGRLDAWNGRGSIGLLREFLLWIYGASHFDTARDHDRSLVELMGEAMETAVSLDAALGASAIDAVAWLGLLLAELDDARLADRRGEADLVLHGWLELPWEPAAGLVIAGFNDESVPGAITPDPFLPDSLRKRLELTCAESRRARDAYLLSAIATQRERGGALRLIVGRTGGEGDVLRPSRLLFACDDASLLARVRLLFPAKEDQPDAAPRPARTIAWKLRPPKPKVPVPLRHVSASLLSAYLKCPLRCYFSHILGMSEIRSGLRELGNDAFGRIVHEVWRRFAQDDAMRDSADAGRIADFLANEAEVVARERYGARPLFAVAMQIESAKQRLRALAATQQKLRQDGWIIQDAELAIQPERGLAIGGVPFKGQIDRVDRHEKTGALRVWDYKTGREGDAAKDHLERIRSGPGEPRDIAWRTWTADDDGALVWKNLQLPLYLWAMRELHPDSVIEAGYLHLPAVVSASGDIPWSELDTAMVDSAHRCATEAVRRIQAGQFWPAEEVKFDEWEELFMGDVVQAVADISEWRDEAA